jgi:hypothetical protein
MEVNMRIHLPEWVQPGLWGAFAGAVVIAVVALSAGWVVTNGSAQRTAKSQSDKAVIAALAPICVAQFKSAPQNEQSTHLAALEKEPSWDRGDYVEKHGWATMPGSKAANDAVAETCTSELLKAAS